MPSTRPKIQAYLDEAIHKRLTDWKIEHGEASESAALNQILAEYFGISQSSNQSQISLKAEIDEYLNKQFNELSNQMGLQLRTQFAIWNKALQDGLSGLNSRIEALEKICEPIEGLGELSNKLHSPPESESEALNCSGLARRLGCNHGTISKNRGKPDFEQWSKERDPDAIAWRYDREKKLFFPL